MTASSYFEILFQAKVSKRISYVSLRICQIPGNFFYSFDFFDFSNFIQILPFYPLTSIFNPFFTPFNLISLIHHNLIYRKFAVKKRQSYELMKCHILGESLLEVALLQDVYKSFMLRLYEIMKKNLVEIPLRGRP